jgi:hypothetical protein
MFSMDITPLKRNGCTAANLAHRLVDSLNLPGDDEEEGEERADD